MSKGKRNLVSQRSCFFLMAASLNFEDACSMHWGALHPLFSSWMRTCLPVGTWEICCHMWAGQFHAQLPSCGGGRMRARGNTFIFQCFGLSLRKEDAQVPTSDLIRWQHAVWNVIISMGERRSCLWNVPQHTRFHPLLRAVSAGPLRQNVVYERTTLSLNQTLNAKLCFDREWLWGFVVRLFF